VSTETPQSRVGITDITVRAIAALLLGGFIFGFGRAFYEQGMLHPVSTFVAFTLTTIIRDRFIVIHPSWSDLDPTSARARLLALMKTEPILDRLVTQNVMQALVAVLFGLLIATLEGAINLALFGSPDTSNPISLIVLAAALILIYGFSGTAHARRTKPSEFVEGLRQIASDKLGREIPPIESPWARSFGEATLRAVVFVVLRLIAMLVLPFLFQTFWASFGAAFGVAFITIFYDAVLRRLRRISTQGLPNRVSNTRAAEAEEALADARMELKQKDAAIAELRSRLQKSPPSAGVAREGGR